MKGIELYLNGLSADLSADVDLQLTYQVNDIRNLGSRESAFSETFTLPSTNRNNFILGNLRQTNSLSDIPYQAVPCKILADGNLLLKGTAYVTEMQEGYSLSVIGKNADLFEMVKDKPLSAIDLSGMDHAWTNETVADKNHDDWSRGYVYPLINYGKFTSRYLEPGNVRFDELRPAVYLRTILELMCAPYTLKGSFVDSTLYSRLILPFTNKTFQYREAYRVQFDTKVKMVQELSLPGIGTYYIKFDVTESDVSGLYFRGATPSDISGYTVPFKGNYEVTAELILNALVDPAVPTKAQIWVNGRPAYEVSVDINSGDNQTVKIEATAYNLSAGDVIYLAIIRQLSPTALDQNTHILPGSTMDFTLQNVVYAGGQVQLDANLPDLTQDELLIDLFNIFNLVVQTDSVSKTIILDFQRDILSRTPVDWSKKIDWIEQHKTVFALEGYAQTNKIAYEENERTDLLGNPEQDSFNLTVANQQLDKEKELFTAKLTNTETLPAFQGSTLLSYIPLFEQQVLNLTIFKPGHTYLANEYIYHPGNGFYWGALKDNPSPVFIYPPATEWNLANESEVIKNLEAKPRIMLLQTRPNPIPVSYDFDPGTVHLLDVEGTFDGLEAEQLKASYYPITQKMLDRSRMLVMNVRLNATDIAGLDFMRPILLNIPERDNLGGLYYLNKINGWQPGFAGATEVELVKITTALAANNSVVNFEYSEEYTEEHN